ncbi:MAG TPA: hypothetical protein VEV83_17265 [Parafilimonas sp.]|nr:hypothetical protein [Parafilimonas sp.]
MAEDEIAKHTKKIYKIASEKDDTFWHKVKDIVMEIAIIVFAVTISIWLHNNSEHHHQQDDVKTFLLGLEKDLTADISEMQNDKQSYEMQRAAFNYISRTRLGETLSPDSLRFYSTWIYNSTALTPNSGRFEGFKSSGKIGFIENDSLQNDIMDLYQENIPSLLASTSNYISHKNVLFEYLQKNLRRETDSTTNLADVMNTEEGHNISRVLSYTTEITGRYDAAINKMKKITAEINREYK